ncbi:MAG: pyridoxal-dependent decarboxylase [Bacteroidales bacterium]|jgi:glutamate/tyrosine decarboxylase-like PLP-dependent enzyme|nr:pyridoxal-dependent decarboxylase [Bacteroidales bacterium]
MENILPWFIGPKAENSATFSELLDYITQDYFHWRRNYFPDDPLLINKSDQRSFEKESDRMHKNIHEFLASLRRNFPFYNPRYIAHMQSDVTMPSMLGYIGAMLYNSNNITPESAPVTAEWEIEACNDILKMLGYKPAPIPPSKEATIKDWEEYQEKLKSEFGWAHISSGGTIANIEALWAARNVKYFPLSIQEVSREKRLRIEIKSADGTIYDIKEIPEFELINIRPNESIYLLSRYIKAYVDKYQGEDINSLSQRAMSDLSKCNTSLSNNMGFLLSKYPLAVFVSGTAHYSINKAADILGIGRNNIRIIEVDSRFRADSDKLRSQIRDCIDKKISPLAVIGIAGTTEGGAIDPIHELVDLRTDIEETFNVSFWLHVDSAWGGYVKTVLELSWQEKFNIIQNKILSVFSEDFPDLNINSITDLYDNFILQFDKIIKYKKKSVSELCEDALKQTNEINKENQVSAYTLNTKRVYDNNRSENIEKLDSIKSGIEHSKERMVDLIDSEGYDNALNLLKEVVKELSEIDGVESYLDNFEFDISPEDRFIDMSEYIKDEITISYKGYKKTKEIDCGDRNLVSSFMAFKYADSITIDPHKLGYIQYPCGVIAFKNDRIRHFLTQKAPYITSSHHNAMLHVPPMHVNDVDFDKLSDKNLPYDEYKVSIDAFAPFILEGSKPGAVAASLWLSNRCIPLNRQYHGSIIKNTLLATRELYEWMINWKRVMAETGEDAMYEFLPVSPTHPDLNVFLFAVKPNNLSNLYDLNNLTGLVYENYSIQAELGDKGHSYSHPYFLSKTMFSLPNYSYNSLADFFEKNGIQNSEEDYKKNGLLVLRATLMNPYIYPYKKNQKLNLIKEFIIDLHKTSNKLAKDIVLAHSY